MRTARTGMDHQSLQCRFVGVDVQDFQPEIHLWEMKEGLAAPAWRCERTAHPMKADEINGPEDAV